MLSESADPRTTPESTSLPTEPLKEVLKIYGSDAENRTKILSYYLPEETSEKLEEYIYCEEPQICDRIIAVKKSTGKIGVKGLTTAVTDEKIKIRGASSRNVSLKRPITEYYFFMKPRKRKLKMNRILFTALLKRFD